MPTHPCRLNAWMATILMGLVLAASWLGCASQHTSSGDLLRVGITPNYPPIVYRDDQGLIGVEPELGRLAAQAIGRRPLFVEMEFGDLIPSLERGEIDVIMSGMSITDGRAQRVLFTEPYMRVGQLALIRANDLSRLGQPGALRRHGARIGYVAGTTGEELVTRELAGAESYAFDTPADGVRSLRAGRIDFFIHDAPTVWRITMQDDGRDLLGLFRPLTEEYLAWAVSPDDPQLKGQLDQVIDDWRANDQLEPILNRWIPVRIQVGH